MASRSAQQPFAFLQINLILARKGGALISLHFQNSLKYNCSEAFMEENNVRQKKMNLIKCLKWNLLH